MSGRHEATPPRHRIEIENGRSFEVGPEEDTLLRGALRAGVPFAYECSVGGCGTCRFELLDGEMASLWDEAPGLSERDRRRGKRLACQSRPLGDCRIRIRLDGGEAPAAQPRRMSATLASRRPISAGMVELSFAMPQPPAFRPGQYALLFPAGVPGARAYSMSNLDGDGLWRFIVRKTPSGRGSSALCDHLPVGARVDIDGPYGHAWLRPAPRDVVCVAGGSGLGPMLSVARGVLAGDGSRRLHFFLGLRTEAELDAAAEADSLDQDRATTTVVLSNPRERSAWHGPRGFVHAEVERSLSAPLDRFDFYFAGPPPMIEAMQELLMVRHRVPFDQIHFDRFV
ncbi:2Fe-2S iron-sulfur cluster-binding protein [Comamonas badia]|uniref:2Fe-2S iron-sulfur cluster-binding protein n=1 Tax=Comamonas badia TaxID=265291 RepID=UPI00040B66E3|nr:2Fe-2S iron-sulfur cluster binding domain-containing protein [Comamonas badia]